VAGGKREGPTFSGWGQDIVQGVARAHPFDESFDNVAGGLVGNKHGQNQAENQPTAFGSAFPNPVKKQGYDQNPKMADIGDKGKETIQKR